MTSPQGAPDFAPAIVATPADSVLLVADPQSIPPGLGYISPTLTVTQPSYLIAGSFTCSPSATIPYLTVQLQWQDADSGVNLTSEQWSIPANTTSPVSLIQQWAGRGPTKGDLLNLEIINQDPTFTVTGHLYFYQSSRVITRDDWRTNRILSPPTITLAQGDPGGLILGYRASTTLTAGSSDTQLLPVYAGQAQLQFGQTAAQACNLFGVPQDYELAALPQLFNFPFAGDEATETITLPRSPVAITVHNGGGASTNVFWTVTAQEFAS